MNLALVTVCWLTLLYAQFPALIVVDQSTDISTVFDPAFDISTCEFINACELNMGIPELRIRKLVSLTEEQSNLRLVKDNAEVILDEVMRQPRDWLDGDFNMTGGKSLKVTCNSDFSFVNSNQVLLGKVIRNLLINSINNTVEGKNIFKRTAIWQPCRSGDWRYRCWNTVRKAKPWL